MKETNERRLAVITGCDSGIGAALCRLYIDAGYDVIAGCFGALPEKAYRFTPLPLDLRSEYSITEFASAAAALCESGERISVLVHNAGTVAAGPVECVPLEALRDVFEVNFFGAYSLTQKLVSTLIRDRGGIAIVGSLAGRIALPLFSPYASSKFALEGFADSLRREMRPFGVRVVLFEPAAVATPIWDSSWQRIRDTCLPAIGPRYRAVFEKIAGRFIAGGNAGMSADKAARQIFRRISRKRPRARYLISKTVFVNKLETLLPDAVMDRLIALAFGTERLADTREEEGLVRPENTK
jgi:NAD(P)-dependent dehydrogenase (short-subunit alcohol dehydrogenase family)